MSASRASHHGRHRRRWVESRVADLQRIYDPWKLQQIDGMYTLSTLGQFRADLEDAARLRRLLP